MKLNKTGKVALYGLLASLALVMSYIESLIPPLMAVPGMKLGLTNIVVLAALYLIGDGGAVLMNVIRILLVSFMFGNGISLWYSLAGGLLSGLVMILAKRTGKLGIITVSILGGVAHNVGQILTAMVLLKTTAVGYYLLILWFSGMAAGAVIGVIGAAVVARLQKGIRRAR